MLVLASKCLNFLDDIDGFNLLINIIIFDIEIILNLLVIVDYILYCSMTFGTSVCFTCKKKEKNTLGG